MPSFFRSDVDVKIVFDKSRSLTPEEKKQKKRLMIPFDQSVRRSGTKGNFFFARKNGSVGGPILILEPQGPVDRGIFQGGITRFGETLNGTFECPKPGFLILYTKKNVSESNKLKFGRDIRKAIKKATGMMSSGGEDRITIITPKDKERVAREAATEKKRLAEESRNRKNQQNADRKLRREELKRKKAEKRAAKAEKARVAPEPEAEAPRDKARPAPKPRKERKERTKRVEKPAPEPKPVVTPEQVEARWEEADTTQEGWLESEAKAQDQEANTISASAMAESARDQADESRESLDKSTKHLKDLRLAITKSGGRAKFDLKQEIAREEKKKAALEVEFERLSAEAVAREAEAAAQTDALATAREEAMVKQIEAAEARLEAAKTEQEAATEDDDGDPEASESAARELADAARQLALAKAEMDVVSSLKQIDTALSGIDHDSDSQEFKSTRIYISALLWENKGLKKGIEKLREAVERIESPSDRVRIMATHWAHHPDIEWAESAVDMLVDS